ncbi:MAG: hypothetical protein ACPGJV_04455 [Bacteriovoracaceae bacterium]
MDLTSCSPQTTLCTIKSWDETSLYPSIKKELESFSDKWDFRLSRLALFQGLSEYGLKPASLRDLELNDKYQLKHYPDYAISISHTHDLAAVSILHKNKLRSSIGIDLEWEQRLENLSLKLSSKIQSFLSKTKIVAHDVSVDSKTRWLVGESLIKALHAFDEKIYSCQRLEITNDRITLSYPKRKFTGKYSITRKAIEDRYCLMANVFILEAS